VEVDVLKRRLEQLGHEGLREPDRPALLASGADWVNNGWIERAG
jgi:hypothetical protein